MPHEPPVIRVVAFVNGQNLSIPSAKLTAETLGAARTRKTRVRGKRQ